MAAQKRSSDLSAEVSVSKRPKTEVQDQTEFREPFGSHEVYCRTGMYFGYQDSKSGWQTHRGIVTVQRTSPLESCDPDRVYKDANLFEFRATLSFEFQPDPLSTPLDSTEVYICHYHPNGFLRLFNKDMGDTFCRLQPPISFEQPFYLGLASRLTALKQQFPTIYREIANVELPEVATRHGD